MLLPLAMYANRFFPPDDERATGMVAITNAAFHACGSFAAATEEDYEETLQDQDAATDDVFDLVIWSLLFIEADLIPGLDLPDEAKKFSPRLWRYLKDYPLEDADEFEDGAWDDEFIETAYLATHIAYIPTGNHRHPIYIEDMPSLYRYHRENFYPTLEMGELDLVAEMVDSLRQYGCTPEMIGRSATARATCSRSSITARTAGWLIARRRDGRRCRRLRSDPQGLDRRPRSP